MGINSVATWERQRRVFMGLVEGACNTANLYTCRLKWTACKSIMQKGDKTCFLEGEIWQKDSPMKYIL